MKIIQVKNIHSIKFNPNLKLKDFFERHLRGGGPRIEATLGEEALEAMHRFYLRIVVIALCLEVTLFYLCIYVSLHIHVTLYYSSYLVSNLDNIFGAIGLNNLNSQYATLPYGKTILVF